MKLGQGFFSRRTLRQIVFYGLVGLAESLGGWEVFKHIHLTQFYAYEAATGLIGFAGFLVRKYWVFESP